MLLLQVMNARRREQPGGAKRGAAVGGTDLWGHGWGNVCPMGNNKGTTWTPNTTEAGPWQENLVFERGGVLLPAHAGEHPAEPGWSRELIPTLRWYPSPFTASEQGCGDTPPRCQAEGCSQYLRHPAPWLLGTQTGCVWGAWHPQRPPMLPERRMLRPLPVESCQV